MAIQKNNNEQIISDNGGLPFRVYSYTKECYKCRKPTEIITYITYADKPTEDVTFPWDMHRLLKHQDISAHMKDSSIEYYGLNVIGNIKQFDYMLMKKYPDRIKKKYSQTQMRTYPMNVCCHCGNGQGWYYIYRDVNELIQARKAIKTI